MCLSSLTLYKYIKHNDHNYKHILAPLISELKCLYSCIDILVNGQLVNVKAKLNIISGDNLSSNYLSGIQTFLVEVIFVDFVLFTIMNSGIT